MISRQVDDRSIDKCLFQARSDFFVRQRLTCVDPRERQGHFMDRVVAEIPLKPELSQTHVFSTKDPVDA